MRELSTEIELAYEDLARLMIILSDNTASNILIDALGMENVNDTIHRMGLKQTKLGRKFAGGSYSPELIEKGYDNLSTPREMVRTMEMLANAKILDRTHCDMALDILRRTSFEYGITRLLPTELKTPETPFGPQKVAHKPGRLPGIYNEVGLVFLPKREYALCIMTKNAEEQEALGTIAEISKAVYGYFWHISRYP